MENKSYFLNKFLVEVFNDILKTEELLVCKTFDNLSLKEIHVIEAVCNAENSDNRATTIADNLMITAGSLTTSVSLLEKKGYLIRQKDEKDKRIVRIFSTDLGKEANERHKDFHKEMVDDILSTINPDEAMILIKALINVSDFFKNKYGK